MWKLKVYIFTFLGYSDALTLPLKKKEKRIKKYTSKQKSHERLWRRNPKQNNI